MPSPLLDACAFFALVCVLLIPNAYAATEPGPAAETHSVVIVNGSFAAGADTVSGGALGKSALLTCNLCGNPAHGPEAHCKTAFIRSQLRAGSTPEIGKATADAGAPQNRDGFGCKR